MGIFDPKSQSESRQKALLKFKHTHQEPDDVDDLSLSPVKMTDSEGPGRGRLEKRGSGAGGPDTKMAASSPSPTATASMAPRDASTKQPEAISRFARQPEQEDAAARLAPPPASPPHLELSPVTGPEPTLDRGPEVGRLLSDSARHTRRRSLVLIIAFALAALSSFREHPAG